ncbi:WD repeat-containing protein 90 [Holothuria leucospilota]|uniref:WD repeat-containing protein 90 n=1 Tax=Holothuria leucospilota TaxID=206669 RepID=A0A9Q1C3E8_HOLLE|nr:WD repeat-containing protein 90 [Holothuria leucospilota]
MLARVATCQNVLGISTMWQHPFVNIFKHFRVGEWKKSSKDGEVLSVMDKTLKCTVYRITGSIPSSNYIQIPKTKSQSLGLTGRYLYVLFKPLPGKYFVVHMDVATNEGLVVRISFSNLFKEFKSTSTWLQFPFVCPAGKGTVEGLTAKLSKKDLPGPAPASSRWTLLLLDFQYILSMYLNRKYSYLKSIQLCSSMFVKNVFTSDIQYEPGITVQEARDLGLLSTGVQPLPREMAFPKPKGQEWDILYNFLRFPNAASKVPYDSIHRTSPSSKTNLPGTGRRQAPGEISPQRVAAREIYRKSKPKVTKELPEVGLDAEGDISILQGAQGEVHVFAHPEDDVTVHRHNKKTGMSLKPDPILSLRRIVAFGGCTTREALWDQSGSHIVYPCHAVIVSMHITTGHQRFFIGHTDKVSALSFNSSCTLLASAQTGAQSIVRVWRYQSGDCLAMFRANAHSLHCLSFSRSGAVLCGVGKDNHGKNLVIAWNTARVSRSSEVSVLAKAHTDVEIIRMKVAPFDESSFACTRSGHIFQIDYSRMSVVHVRRLLPSGKHVKDKSTFGSGPGIAINTMAMSEAFCVTGSDDGFLRLWPLDFSSVFLEAEHEGPVTVVGISVDGLNMLAGTSTGNLGYLDISTRNYTTVMRSHTGRILCMSIDPVRRQLATVSQDHTIRLWDLDSLQQMFDFHSPDESPTTICYHPTIHSFACGFDSGCVRIFSVSSTKMLAELKQHKGSITGLLFSPNGACFYSCSSVGTLALYDSSDEKYPVMRLLGNMVARGEKFGPEALSASEEGRHVAFVGPSEFAVTVVDGKNLDEVLRIDISSMAPDVDAVSIDTAVRVHFAPAKTKQLLVGTASCNLLRFDSKTGRLLNKVSGIHRSGITGLDVCNDWRHLATTGDRVVKVWDYHMRLDLNFQVFIGHSESIQQVKFTPDSLRLITIGEGIFVWDFYGANRDPETYKSHSKPENKLSKSFSSPVRRSLEFSSSLEPRSAPPKPTTPTNLSEVSRVHPPDEIVIDEESSKREEEVLLGPELESRSELSSIIEEVLRIDISSMAPDVDAVSIDTAVRVHFAPAKTKQLLVGTASCNLLRFDSKTGRLLNKVSGIHRSGITGLDVCSGCRHLATTGDRVVKVWDYHMRLDLNFQVFIGHSESIQQVKFTPDSLRLITIGEGIFVWDFYGANRDPETYKSHSKPENKLSKSFSSPVRRSLEFSSSLEPRSAPPKPTTPTNLSEVSRVHPPDEIVIDEESSKREEEVLLGPELESRSELSSIIEEDSSQPADTLGRSHRTKPHRRPPSVSENGNSSPPSQTDEVERVKHHKPSCLKHFVARANQSQMAQRRYTAPPNQAGVRLKSVLGFNGNGCGNVVWHPDTGLFAYTSGCIIVIEDLNDSSQRHLLGHVEEISFLTLQHDAQILASASGSRGLTGSQICLWDVGSGICRKVLSYHEHQIVCLAFSRDDRFLISVGDYRECSVVVWDTQDYAILAASKTALPIHDLVWDPHSPNEFATVGERGTVLFWLLDETHEKFALNIHEAVVPQDLMDTRNMILGDVSFTCTQYGGDSVLYVGTNTGVLSAWDTRHNSCFMHWEADSAEIDVIVCRFGSSRLITGGASRLLRLWSVYGMGELRLLPDRPGRVEGQGLVMEDEMTLDGAITAGEFDDTLDVGVVATSEGTLWYINWVERTSVRLVGSHSSKINELAFGENDLFATSCEDGSLRIYSLEEMEPTVQFQVLDQSCNCLSFSPALLEASSYPSRIPLAQSVVAGYSDGTVRLFDLRKVEMVLKMQPHAVAVTKIMFSADGHVLISGSSDGIVAVSSPTTGITMRVISEHRGAPITDLHVSSKQETENIPGLHCPHLWLAASADRRVSVWSSDWPKDFCEMVDWLTFPAPAFAPDGTAIHKKDVAHFQLLPKSLAQFSPSDPDIIVYVGYGMQKTVNFYSILQKKVVRTSALTHWSTALDVSPLERLVKLMDYSEGSFQDFVGHYSGVQVVKFTPSGSLLFTVSHNEILVWEVII